MKFDKLKPYVGQQLEENQRINLSAWFIVQKINGCALEDTKASLYTLVFTLLALEDYFFMQSLRVL